MDICLCTIGFSKGLSEICGYVMCLKIGILAVDLTELSCLQDGEKNYFIQLISVI